MNKPPMRLLVARCDGTPLLDHTLAAGQGFLWQERDPMLAIDGVGLVELAVPPPVPPPAFLDAAGAAWLREHADDLVQVSVIDLISVVTRLEQVSREPGFETADVTHERIFTCDLPRLRGYLPDEAAAIIDADLG